MREPASPGWRTHLMFARFDGEVRDAGDHWVIRSPSSPGFYWGNFVLFDRAPGAGDFEGWMRTFDDAIVRHAPGTGHRAFGIAEPADACTAPPEFIEAGFECYPQATLTLQRAALQPLPAPPDPSFELRPLDLAREREAVVELSAAGNDGYEAAGYRRFRDHQMLRYAAMQAAGLGHWWGAWYQGWLVAGLGLFGRDGIGRFQYVETHPAFRRRGLCRALVHAACRHGFEQRGWHTLVMGADPHDVAIGIYRQVGFGVHDTLWLLERRAPEDRAAGA
ncbi:MAG: GNAT family N-acetyltransferase [Rubrivivax sp.]